MPPAQIEFGLGIRGNDDWVTDERPQNFREMILFLWPNGDAPLTAMMAAMKSQSVNDPQFHWFTKTLPTRGGTVVNVHEVPELGNAYDAGDDFPAGSTVYLEVALAVAKEFAPQDVALMRDQSQPTNDIRGKVTDIVYAGAASVIHVILLEADGVARMATDLSDCDFVTKIGSMNPEGGTIPSVISYQPTKLTNFTQIFRTPVAITRTARKTRLRTGNGYEELRREALQLHTVSIEQAYFWGIATENTGSNGEPERSTGGIVEFIANNASDNVFDFKNDTAGAFSGMTWDQAGEEWFNEKLEIMFRYGSSERIMYCGSGAIKGINRLAQLSGHINMEVGTAQFGIRVRTWITPFGTIHLINHPLFTQDATVRHRAIAVSPEFLTERVIDQTFYKRDDGEKKAGQIGFDGIKEEWLTEVGLELAHPFAFADFSGVGEDNVN